MRAFRLLLVGLMLATLPVVAAAPETDKRAAALAVLLPNPPDPLGDEDVAIKPWPNGPAPRLWVAAILLRGSDAGTLSVGIFRETNGSLALLARNDDGEAEADEPLWSTAIGLDLIAYRISPGETAFGVIVENSYASTARTSGSRSLQLYRYHDKTLSPIFSAIVSRNNYDRVSAEECEGKTAAQNCGEQNSTVEDFVVSFSPHRTDGFFDLLLRPKGGGKAEHYTWMGDKYEAGGEKAQ
jgi:hypothetical protein